MSDSVEVAEDRSRLERAPPGDKFPDPIGTLGEADRTAENLKAMRFPYRMYAKALKHTGGIEEVRCCVWFEAIVRLTACIPISLSASACVRCAVDRSPWITSWPTAASRRSSGSSGAPPGRDSTYQEPCA